MTPVTFPTLLRRRVLLAVAAALPLGLAACGAGPAGSAPEGATGSSSTTTPAGSATGAAGSAAALDRAFVAAVARVRPDVVEISTSSGLGSGVVYDHRGDIVTNDHVVGSETTFTVHLADGRTVAATLVGRYAPDDLAVIRARSTDGLSPATFGNSATVPVGAIVFAVGNPLGLASSVTQGIVSYNGRPVSEGNGVTLPSTIQTSAPINPGNSGGALVDLAGKVIGIPTLAAVSQQSGGEAAGIGFAIPSKTVQLIAPQLIATGHVAHSDRAALGIQGGDAVDASGAPAGVIVAAVTAGGGAARAGIAAGDVITAVAGQSVTSLADLSTVLAERQPGDTVAVTVVAPDGSQRTVRVVLEELRA